MQVPGGPAAAEADLQHAVEPAGIGEAHRHEARVGDRQGQLIGRVVDRFRIETLVVPERHAHVRAVLVDIDVVIGGAAFLQQLLCDRRAASSEEKETEGNRGQTDALSEGASTRHGTLTASGCLILPAASILGQRESAGCGANSPVAVHGPAVPGQVAFIVNGMGLAAGSIVHTAQHQSLRSTADEQAAFNVGIELGRRWMTERVRLLHPALTCTAKYLKGHQKFNRARVGAPRVRPPPVAGEACQGQAWFR